VCGHGIPAQHLRRAKRENQRKQAAPKERLAQFTNHILQTQLDYRSYGFAKVDSNMFLSQYSKDKSPLKKQAEHVWVLRNQSKEIVVVHVPRLRRVRRPTEVLNKLGLTKFGFTQQKEEEQDPDFRMFYDYGRGMLDSRPERQTFSSLLLVYYSELFPSSLLPILLLLHSSSFFFILLHSPFFFSFLLLASLSFVNKQPDQVFVFLLS